MNQPAVNEFSLRRFERSDETGLYELLCLRDVYRYLCDDVRPTRELARSWVEGALAEPESPLGFWVLDPGDRSVGGCVRLVRDPDLPQAEIAYALHPGYWGRGVATAMSWSIMKRAFAHGVDSIFAGADGPNLASIEVMKRLGMRFWREASYAAGPGVEYLIASSDPGPDPAPRMLRIIE